MLHNMILDCVTNSFNVIPHLFICSRELRIIEYVQSQRTTKTSNMESFRTIVNKALLKSILRHWWVGLKNKGREIFFLDFLWWSDC